jgi:hypothetical protein
MMTATMTMMMMMRVEQSAAGEIAVGEAHPSATLSITNPTWKASDKD